MDYGVPSRGNLRIFKIWRQLGELETYTMIALETGGDEGTLYRTVIHQDPSHHRGPAFLCPTPESASTSLASKS